MLLVLIMRPCLSHEQPSPPVGRQNAKVHMLPLPSNLALAKPKPQTNNQKEDPSHYQNPMREKWGYLWGISRKAEDRKQQRPRRGGRQKGENCAVRPNPVKEVQRLLPPLEPPIVYLVRNENDLACLPARLRKMLRPSKLGQAPLPRMPEHCAQSKTKNETETRQSCTWWEKKQSTVWDVRECRVRPS